MRSVHTATVRVLVAERLMHRLTALGMAVGSATLQWVTAGAVACSTPSLLRAKWDAARTQWRCSGDAVGIQTCEPPTTLHCARSTHSAVGPAVAQRDYVPTTSTAAAVVGDCATSTAVAAQRQWSVTCPEPTHA